VSKQSLLESIAGGFCGEILLQLKRLKVLSELKQWRASGELAKKLHCDPFVLGVLLEFLSENSEVIARSTHGKYKTGLNSRKMMELGFCLEKFVGAYGPATRNVRGVLLQGSVIGKILDEQALASAYAELGIVKNPVIPEAVERNGIRCLLDLACGTSSLLIELGLRNPAFRGYGIDSNPAMCRISKSRLRALKLNRRVEIRQGDACNIQAYLKPREIREIEAVHGRSLLNEFFGRGSEGAVRLLQNLRLALPGRVAWFVDYYGRLGSRSRPNRRFLYTSLQDVAQLLSGQGIPPPDQRTWRKIYEGAGCRLIEARAFRDESISWFIHTVRL
jgi:hypothetical protein